MYMLVLHALHLFASNRLRLSRFTRTRIAIFRHAEPHALLPDVYRAFGTREHVIVMLCVLLVRPPLIHVFLELS